MEILNNSVLIFTYAWFYKSIFFDHIRYNKFLLTLLVLKLFILYWLQCVCAGTETYIILIHQLFYRVLWGVFLYPVYVMSGVCAPVSCSDVYVYAPSCVCERMRACRRKGRAPFHRDTSRELLAPAPVWRTPARHREASKRYTPDYLTTRFSRLVRSN